MINLFFKQPLTQHASWPLGTRRWLKSINKIFPRLSIHFDRVCNMTSSNIRLFTWVKIIERLPVLCKRKHAYTKIN